MITEFLVKIAAEATVISAVLAGVRRGTGFDVPRMLATRLQNPTARNAANKYLDLGEYCFDKGMKAVNHLRSKETEEVAKKIGEKAKDKIKDLKD